VVLNVQPDHLGLRGVDTLEQLADVKAVIVEAVPRNGFAVLNADDPLVRAMRRRCAGRIVWFTMAEPSGEIRDFVDDHCRRGGLAVVLEHSDLGDMIVVKEGRRAMQLAWTHLLPATFDGRATMNVQNAMAAAAAAFAAGASLHDIRQGLRTFSTNYYLSPGRLNEVSVAGRTVIIDYCHNVPGMIMLGDFVDKTGDALEATNDLGRISRIGLIATAGDRRNDDMRELGHEAARHFDVLIVREDSNLRARPPGEVANLIAGGARQAMMEGARCKQVEIVLDELASVRHAMSRSNPGDLVVICVEQHAAVMAALEAQAHHAQPGARREADRELSNAVPDPDFAPDATHDEPELEARKNVS
jgi:cyanophycin synthetase